MSRRTITSELHQKNGIYALNLNNVVKESSLGSYNGGGGEGWGGGEREKLENTKTLKAYFSWHGFFLNGNKSEMARKACK